MVYTFMQKKVLSALEDAGLFTSGGLVKDKVINVCIAGSIWDTMTEVLVNFFRVGKVSLAKLPVFHYLTVLSVNCGLSQCSSLLIVLVSFFYPCDEWNLCRLKKKGELWDWGSPIDYFAKLFSSCCTFIFFFLHLCAMYFLFQCNHGAGSLL